MLAKSDKKFGFVEVLWRCLWRLTLVLWSHCLFFFTNWPKSPECNIDAHRAQDVLRSTQVMSKLYGALQLKFLKSNNHMFSNLLIFLCENNVLQIMWKMATQWRYNKLFMFLLITLITLNGKRNTGSFVNQWCTYYIFYIISLQRNQSRCQPWLNIVLCPLIMKRTFYVSFKKRWTMIVFVVHF